MSDDPFMVPVPDGATHIDLREFLVPLLRAIMRQGGKWEHVGDESVDRYFDRLLVETRITRKLETVNPRWIVDYMKAKQWRASMVSSHGTRQLYPPEKEPYYGPTGICIIMKLAYVPEKTETENYNEVQQAWRAVKDITRFEGSRSTVTLCEIEKCVQRIIDHVDPVTRLGQVTDAPGV